MSTEPIKTPNPRRLRLIGAAALAIAASIAAAGILERSYGAREVAQWTDAQAVPTVALAPIQHGDATAALTLPGTIQPYNKASIYARVSGYLKSWQADIGASVKAGQSLATIDTPELDQQLDQAEADLATAEANERLAALTAKRWQALIATQAVAQQAADEKSGDAAAKQAILAAAQANVRRLQALESFKEISAPFDGTVTARKTDIGALITAGSAAGQELFEVSDLHKVRIYVQVPQAFSAALRVGLTAHIELPQFPGQQFDAAIVAISNAMEAGSHSMLVELQAGNAEGKLSAGAYCQVHFDLPGDPNLLRLPATALIPADRGVQVAALAKDGKVELKTIQLGRDLGDTVEVTAGLSPADRIIDNPPETLQSGDTVQLAAPKVNEIAAQTQATKGD